MQNGNGNGDGDGEGGGEKESATKRKKRLSILGEERKKGGFNLMSLVVNVVIAVVVAGVMVYMLAPTKNSLSAIQSSINSNIEQQTGRLNVLDTNQRDILDALEAVNAVEESLASLESQTATLSAQVTNLEAKVDTTVSDAESKANAIIAAWEAARVVEEEEAAVEDYVRWTWRRATISSATVLVQELIAPYITTRIECDRVEEPDLYEVELEIRNSHTVGIALTNCVIELVLIPRDYIAIDEDETYIDSDDSPFLNWDTDFVIREREGVDVCRRIYFATDHSNIGTIPAGSTETLELVLELKYLD